MIENKNDQMSNQVKSTEVTKERSEIPLEITDVNLFCKVRSTHGLGRIPRGVPVVGGARATEGTEVRSGGALKGAVRIRW